MVAATGSEPVPVTGARYGHAVPVTASTRTRHQREHNPR